MRTHTTWVAVGGVVLAGLALWLGDGTTEAARPGRARLPQSRTRYELAPLNKIVFTSERDDEDGDIYVAYERLTGVQVKRLTNSPRSDGGASWSPDGKRIAFSSCRDDLFRLFEQQRSRPEWIVDITTLSLELRGETTVEY